MYKMNWKKYLLPSHLGEGLGVGLLLCLTLGFAACSDDDKPNEEQRIEAEQTRENHEQQRIAAEQGRVSAESGRVNEFQQMMRQAGTAIEGAENVDAELDGYDLTITNRQGVQKTVYTKGVSGGMLFPVINFDPATGILTISGLQQEVDRIRYDYETAELIISFPNA